jgi:hypothetical protein
MPLKRPPVEHQIAPRRECRSTLWALPRRNKQESKPQGTAAKQNLLLKPIHLSLASILAQLACGKNLPGPSALASVTLPENRLAVSIQQVSSSTPTWNLTFAIRIFCHAFSYHSCRVHSPYPISRMIDDMVASTSISLDYVYTCMKQALKNRTLKVNDERSVLIESIQVAIADYELGTVKGHIYANRDPLYPRVVTQTCKGTSPHISY